MKATWYKSNGSIYHTGEVVPVTIAEVTAALKGARCKAEASERGGDIYVTYADADYIKVMKCLATANFNTTLSKDFDGFRINGLQLDITPEQLAYNLEDIARVGA